MNQEHHSGLGSNNFPLPSFSLTTSNDINLPVSLPAYTMSETFSSMMHSDVTKTAILTEKDPSPPRSNNPSPPVSPLPLMMSAEEAFLPVPLSSTSSSFPSEHSTVSYGSTFTSSTTSNDACPLSTSLASKPGFGVNPSALPTRPPCPLNKERLECTKKGYGVHLQGEFIAMPPPPATITLHTNPVEPIMNGDKSLQLPVVYTSAASYTPCGVAYSTNHDHEASHANMAGGSTASHQTPPGSGHHSPVLLSDTSNMTNATMVHAHLAHNTFATGTMYSHGVMPSQMATASVLPSSMFHQQPVPPHPHQVQAMSMSTMVSQHMSSPPQNYPSMFPNAIPLPNHPSLNQTPRHRDETAKYHVATQSTTQSNDDDSGDDHNEDETGLTPDEIKKRRLRRKAELARASRLSKKNKLQELESECANLRQQLSEARNAQVASVGVGLSDLQSALQSIANVIVPALQVLSGQTHIPATVNGMSLQPVFPGTNTGAQTAALITSTANRTLEAASVVAKTLPSIQCPPVTLPSTSVPPHTYSSSPHPFSVSHLSQAMSTQLAFANTNTTGQHMNLQTSSSSHSDSDQSHGRSRRGHSSK